MLTITLTNMKDLFEYPELLPDNVLAVIDKYAEMDMTYENCNDLIDDLYDVGYTCEYGLDACPYNLRKLEDANEDHAHLMWALNNEK